MNATIHHLAGLKDKRRIAAEQLDKVADQIDHTGMTAMLRKWRDDLSKLIDHLDTQIKATRPKRQSAK
jgi:hypothetical protein